MESQQRDSADDLGVRVCITDGGQMQPPEQDDPDEVEITREEDEEEADADDEAGEEEDAEPEEADDAAEEDVEEEEADEEEAETTILDLTIDGLFLDLLGLEVDLDEVHLDITANPGEGKLLGNLLEAVSGLLDSPGALLGGEGEGGLVSNLMPSLPSLNPMERARALAAAIADKIRGAVEQVVGLIPFEQLLARFFQELVEQLLPVEDVGEEQDEAEATA